MRITLNGLRPALRGPAIPRCNPAAMLALAACIHAGLAAAASTELPAVAGTEPSTLPRLVAEALRSNPEIRAARHERDASIQRVSPAGALDDPMLEAGVVNVPSRSFSFSREDMTMKMLGLSQRLPFPGKRGLRRSLAEHDARTVAHAYQETVNRVARDTKVAYYELALALESARLADRNRATLRQLLKVAEGRYAVGRGSQVDVLKAQTQLSRLTEELIRLERERPALEAELIRLVGRSATAAPPLPEPLRLDEAPLAFDALHKEALAGRPQLLALDSAIARSESALELAAKERYPDFDVRLSYGQRESMPDGTPRSDLVTLTVAMNLPVWRAAKTEPRVVEAQALRDQALSLQQAQRSETAMKLRQQIATAEQSARAVRLYESEILPQSRLAAEAALAAYNANRLDFAPLLDNQMVILSSEIGRAGAIAAYNKARADIELLIGRSPE
jgi:outer membrane protein, heavy metal efflux system